MAVFRPVCIQTVHDGVFYVCVCSCAMLQHKLHLYPCRLLQTRNHQLPAVVYSTVLFVLEGRIKKKKCRDRPPSLCKYACLLAGRKQREKGKELVRLQQHRSRHNIIIFSSLLLAPLSPFFSPALS